MPLRGYTAADLAELHALDQACFPPGIAYSRSELRGFLDHPSSFTTVACAEDRSIAGFAIVRPTRRIVRSPSSALKADPGFRTAPALRAEPALMTAVLHVITIDVAPGARRQGVGGLLMRWILTRAEALHSRSIVLEVAVDNEAARRFYQSFGFAVTGTIPGYYNGVTDALELERITEQPGLAAPGKALL